MAIQFPVFDFNETSYDQSKDAIIVENTQAIKSFNAFRKNIKNVHGELGEAQSTTMTRNDEYTIIPGVDFYNRFIKSHPTGYLSHKKGYIGVKNIPDVDDNKKVLGPDLEPNQFTDYLRELVNDLETNDPQRVFKMHSNPVPYFREQVNDTDLEKNKPSIIPSIPLKKYLVGLQNQLDTPTMNFVRRSPSIAEGDTTASDNVDDITYTPTEAMSVLNNVESLIDNMVEYGNITADVLVTGEASQWYNTETNQVEERISKLDVSIDTADIVAFVKTNDGNKYTMSVRQPFNYRPAYGSPTPGSVKSGFKYATRNDGKVFYENGINLPIPRNVGRSGNIPAFAYLDMEDTGFQFVETTNTVYYWKSMKTSIGPAALGHIPPSGKIAKIDDMSSESNADSMYVLLQLVGFISDSLKGAVEDNADELLVFALEHLDPLTGYDWKVEFDKRFRVRFTLPKEVLKNAVSMAKARIGVSVDVITSITDEQKNSALGKILENSGYLEPLLHNNSINDLSNMYLAFYVPLTPEINGLNDKDESVDRATYIKTMQLLGARAWKYMDVMVWKRDYFSVGFNYERASTVCLVPNWNKLRKAPPRIGGRILSLCLKLEYKNKKPKKNWVGVIISVVVAIVTTIVCTGCSVATWQGVLGLIGVTAAWVGAFSLIAVQMTNSKTWGEVGKAAGVIGSVSALASGLMSATKTFVAKAVMVSIKISSIGMQERQKRKMKDYKKKAKEIETEHRDILTIDDHFDIAKKVDRFIFTDSYSAKYDYDNIYSETPKRC